ncbi:PH domain-containing protein [Bowmanella dokdonensis]|uniref:PH domain-containing protein n=1 Tax=Bowmanella dokdonensis TaxID=751969 RepID=A0A939INC2_9ALTE|nr:PH domain-containing protein [Bowmanella dokdonensis]MBN7826198.1 PH domain-containing protein [Bowmanella dokdonensis]
MDTLFTNTNLSHDRLPTISTLQFMPLGRRYAPLNLLCNLSFFLVLMLLACAIRWQPWFAVPQWLDAPFPYLLGTLLLLGICLPTYWYLADKRKGYALREQDLSFKSGLLFERIVTQPILRVQHVELKRGPVERRAGLGTLEVYSAGGTLHTFAIPGLPEQTAKQLRQFILSHGDVGRDG